ncbi:MAG: arginine--tRNA ligase, partial [Deltaproteobacteria bacterium]|nr:arginine--tRNA ligase [Deltaproteobacteria bacterium]
MKNQIADLLLATLATCFKKGVLRETALPDYVIEVPNNQDHGHFATNLALTLASSQKRSPREIAGVLVEHLRARDSLLERVEIAGPGFINFT